MVELTKKLTYCVKAELIDQIEAGGRDWQRCGEDSATLERKLDFKIVSKGQLGFLLALYSQATPWGLAVQ